MKRSYWQSSRCKGFSSAGEKGEDTKQEEMQETAMILIWDYGGTRVWLSVEQYALFLSSLYHDAEHDGLDDWGDIEWEPAVAAEY